MAGRGRDAAVVELCSQRWAGACSAQQARQQRATTAARSHRRAPQRCSGPAQRRTLASRVRARCEKMPIMRATLSSTGRPNSRSKLRCCTADKAWLTKILQGRSIRHGRGALGVGAVRAAAWREMPVVLHRRWHRSPGCRCGVQSAIRHAFQAIRLCILLTIGAHRSGPVASTRDASCCTCPLPKNVAGEGRSRPEEPTLTTSGVSPARHK